MFSLNVSTRLSFLAVAVALLNACSGSHTVSSQLPVLPTAQSPSRTLNAVGRPARVKLIVPGYTFFDLGTLGGPVSDMNGDTPILSNSDQAFGVADTAAANPYYPNFNPLTQPPGQSGDPYLFHGFVWDRSGMTDLGSLPGTNDSFAGQAGAPGEATGASENGMFDPLTGWPEAHAVLWSRGKIVDLGTLGGGYESFAAEMNNRGQVTGVSGNTIPDPYSLFPFNAQTRGFIWEKGTGMRDIGTLGGPDTIALYINARGQISGWSYTNSTPNPTTGLPTLDPFLWYRDKMTDLGTLGGVLGETVALSESGDVAGTSDLAGDQTFHPFLWRHGRLIDLGTLGGDYGFGSWVNNAGQVAGVAFTRGNNAFHAFRWTRGVMTDLGTLEGDQCSNAIGMNARGDVVGASSACAPGTASAYLWRNGTLIDLNDYVPPSSNLHLFEALYINDNGAIAGHGRLPDGTIHAFVLLPSGRATIVVEHHVSYRSAATAKRPTLREMLTYLFAEKARMKRMPFLNRKPYP